MTWASGRYVVPFGDSGNTLSALILNSDYVVALSLQIKMHTKIQIK